MSTKDDNKPRYREVTAEVRFLYQIWKDEDEDLASLTLEQMAHNIAQADIPALWKGAWGITLARNVDANEAEKIAIELGHCGYLPQR